MTEVNDPDHIHVSPLSYSLTPSLFFHTSTSFISECRLHLSCFFLFQFVSIIFVFHNSAFPLIAKYIFRMNLYVMRITADQMRNLRHVSSVISKNNSTWIR